MPRTIHDLYSACFHAPVEQLKKGLPHYGEEDVLEVWQALSTRPQLIDQTKVMIEHVVKTGVLVSTHCRQSFLKYLLMMTHEYQRTSDLDAFMDAVMSSPPQTPLLSTITDEFFEKVCSPAPAPLRPSTPSRTKPPLVHHLFKHPLMFQDRSPLLLSFATQEVLFAYSKAAIHNRDQFFEQVTQKQMVDVIGWLKTQHKNKKKQVDSWIDQWISHCTSKSNAWWCDVARLEKDKEVERGELVQTCPQWEAFLEKFHLMNALDVQTIPSTPSCFRKI